MNFIRRIRVRILGWRLRRIFAHMSRLNTRYMRLSRRVLRIETKIEREEQAWLKSNSNSKTF